MKKLLVLLLLALVLSDSPALAQSQSHMNSEAAASFQKADAELNRIYVAVITHLDNDGRAKLKIAQRAWIAFRDAQADFAADQEARGGSMAPTIYEGVRASLTKERIAELKKLQAEAR